MERRPRSGVNAISHVADKNFLSRKNLNETGNATETTKP
jgi:hypothetical protein